MGAHRDTRAGTGPTPLRADGHPKVVRALVAGVHPLDGVERDDRDRVRAWLDSTDDVWRRAKPATPSPHLVSYIVVVDPAERRVLLVEHRLAGLWLPAGGHVEPQEHPIDTVRREAREELGLDEVTFLAGVPRPFFLTWTRTLGQAQHVDVSLWFALEARTLGHLDWDRREFASVRWWSLDDVRSADPRTLDPQMGRALTKLESYVRPPGTTPPCPGPWT